MSQGPVPQQAWRSISGDFKHIQRFHGAKGAAI